LIGSHTLDVLIVCLLWSILKRLVVSRTDAFNTGPALKIKQKKRTLVAIDTSGSVSNDDLIEFFNEIYHIYKSGTYVDIIECDAKIQRVYEYKGQREEIEVQGRGGTDFEPVMQYLAEHRNEYANLIYLTDGECCSPQDSTYEAYAYGFIVQTMILIMIYQELKLEL
jgi:predicted metal-dependent peptidase